MGERSYRFTYQNKLNFLTSIRRDLDLWVLFIPLCPHATKVTSFTSTASGYGTNVSTKALTFQRSTMVTLISTDKLSIWIFIIGGAITSPILISMKELPDNVIEEINKVGGLTLGDP